MIASRIYFLGGATISKNSPHISDWPLDHHLYLAELEDSDMLNPVYKMHFVITYVPLTRPKEYGLVGRKYFYSVFHSCLLKTDPKCLLGLQFILSNNELKNI